MLFCGYTAQFKQLGKSATIGRSRNRQSTSSTLMFSLALVSNRSMPIWLANCCASSVRTTLLTGSSFLLPTTDKHACIQINHTICNSTCVIIIIITTTMFMVLSSWQSHCESSPGSFDECRMGPSGRRPKTKPDNLGCESACTGCQKLHPPSPFIITQPES